MFITNLSCGNDSLTSLESISWRSDEVWSLTSETCETWCWILVWRCIVSLDCDQKYIEIMWLGRINIPCITTRVEKRFFSNCLNQYILGHECCFILQPFYLDHMYLLIKSPCIYLMFTTPFYFNFDRGFPEIPISISDHYSRDQANKHSHEKMYTLALLVS